MDIYELTDFPSVSAKAMELAETGTEGLVVAIMDSMWLATGATADTYSEEERQALDIPVFKSQYIGGSCVVFPGDLSFCEIHHGISNFGQRVMEAVRTYLRNFGITTNFFGNDLMIYSQSDNDWLKIASFGSGWLSNGYVQTVVHVSIGMDEGLVNRLCTKQRIKRPGGLGTYGITAQDVYERLKSIIEALYAG